MENVVLEDIKNYAIKRLNQQYGFCGAASGDTMAMLNTTDDKGNDIVIEIKVKSSDS